MAIAVSFVGPDDRDLLFELRERGFRATHVPLDGLDAAHPLGSKGPDAFVVDVRALERLPREVAQLKKQFPATGIVIVARTLEPTEMLEAMRVGVNEWVAEPVSQEELSSAIARVARHTVRPMLGRTLGVIGAKGGVGSTTVAVNLATALRSVTGHPTLLMDLHLAHGDTAVFLGVEPRFSVLDAIENIHRLDESYFKGLVTSTKAGPDLLGSSSRVLHQPVDVLRVRSLIEFAATAYHYVVLDCPRADPTMLEALDAASSVVVVANQELTALRSASRIAAGLRQRCGAERVRLALSRFDPQSDITHSDVERVLGGPVKYVFPSDYRTSIGALNRGAPLILQNHSQLASSFELFARDLAGLPPKHKDAPRGGGLFARFGGRK